MPSEEELPIDQLTQTLGNRRDVAGGNASSQHGIGLCPVPPSAASRPDGQSPPAGRSLEEAILEMSRDAIVAVDGDGRVAVWNPAAKLIFGYDRDEVIGRPIADLIVQEASDRIHDCGSGQSPASGESSVPARRVLIKGVRKGGEEFPAEMSVFSAPTLGNGPPLSVAHLHDLTESRRIEATINEQKLLAAYYRDIGSLLIEDAPLRGMLASCLQATVGHLDAAFARIWIADESEGLLEFQASVGIDTDVFGPHGRMPVGPSLIGQIARDRKPHLTNALVDDERFHDQEWARREGLVAFAGYPLVVDDGLVGVMAMFSRHEMSDASLRMLGSVANKIALGIERKQVELRARSLFANMETAYDATIDGWARALDLRDHETEGHSRRVTEITMELARSMGMTEAELVQVRRGAQLHDIGKMGIPDAILLKPGPLTDDEWVVMRRHPKYAYDWLSPIEFIRPALEIPYCHHEKWDGSGYPRGLIGDQIPMAARMFSAVDICDALLADRPYRKSWPIEQVCAHIRSLSGSHLDPRVVEAFLPMIGKSVRPQPPRSTPSDVAREANAGAAGSKAFAAAFDAMLEHSDDFVVVFDSHWRIEAAGRSFISSFTPGLDPRGLDFITLLESGSDRKLGSLLDRTGTGSWNLELVHVTGAKPSRLVSYTIFEVSSPSEARLFTAVGRCQEATLELVQMLILQNKELEESQALLAQLALSDPLTGLGNRRWLYDQLEVLWAQGRRQGRLAWIMMADLDHFKAVNDRYGHQVGDDVLMAASRAMRGSIRTEDLVARHGGEEFVLAGLCSLEAELPMLAFRVLKAIRGLRIETHLGPLSVTCSIGIALAEPDPSNLASVVLKSADHAMYQAKLGGRDRFEVEPGVLGRTPASSERVQVTGRVEKTALPAPRGPVGDQATVEARFNGQGRE